MTTKICKYCRTPFKVRDSQIRKLYCDEKCKDICRKEQKEYEEYLNKEQELIAKEYENMQFKKEVLIMKETLGWSRVQEPSTWNGQ